MGSTPDLVDIYIDPRTRDIVIGITELNSTIDDEPIPEGVVHVIQIDIDEYLKGNRGKLYDWLLCDKCQVKMEYEGWTDSIDQATIQEIYVCKTCGARVIIGDTDHLTERISKQLIESLKE